DPALIEKQPPQGSTFVSSLRMPLCVLPNGGLFGKLRPPERRSRRKNRPRPARGAVRPSPLTSQAMPRRGAIASHFWSCSERFGPAIPPLNPASLQGLVPGTSSRPLQGSPPSAELNSDGTKLVCLSSLA